jgi:sugar lactone lactonase YvrE
VAETIGRRLAAFGIARDGTLGPPRTWADLGRGLPDGICLDAEGAVWYADPRASACTRVGEGGEVLDSVHTEQSCYACALGGVDRRTLFLLTAAVDDPDEARKQRSARVLAIDVAVPGAGWP